MDNAPIRVVVADDHELLREGLRYALEATAEFTVVAEASDGTQAMALCLRLCPDAVIVDVSMPGMPVGDLVRGLCALPDAPRVLILTSYASDAQIVALLEAGASGFVMKDGGRHELMQALRSVVEGGSWLHPVAQAALLMHARQRDVPGVALTPREHCVLLLIARGMSNKRIAIECNLTEGTVKSYVSQIFQKLRVQDRTGAAMHAVRHGWIELERTNAAQKNRVRPASL
jgi:DNA-binding NarL/FixJ family response regulator